MSLKQWVNFRCNMSSISVCVRGHIKDFTANKEGKVIAIGKLLAGCIPKDTSTTLRHCRCGVNVHAHVLIFRASTSS